MVNVESLVSAYRARFPESMPRVVVRAPGRVNLIGEHVDYHEGLVLPVAIEAAIYAVAGGAPGAAVEVFSETLNDTRSFDLPAPPPSGARDWGQFVVGVAAELARAGVDLVGSKIYLAGDLPMATGLASSAALELASALALLGVAGAELSPAKVAEACRNAEHVYAGVPCGIMDQLVCACAQAGSALLIDCRDRSLIHVPWPAEAVVWIVDSRETRELASGAYRNRVSDTAATLARLKARGGPPVRNLRDVSMDMLSLLGTGPSVRRAGHVVSEIARTTAAVEALRRGDLLRFGALMNESHASLRDDFGVSTPRLDALADLLPTLPSVYGAKLTGAGFGGCVVAVARDGSGDQIGAAVRHRYDPKFGVEARIWSTVPCQGATVSRLED